MVDKKMTPEELKWHRLHDPLVPNRIWGEAKKLSTEEKKRDEEFIKGAWASFEKHEKNNKN